MSRRFFAIFATAYLCLMTYGLARAAEAVPVWVALSESFGPHVEAAAALRAEVDQALPGRVEWRIAHWSSFSTSGLELQWIVAVGTAALKGMQTAGNKQVPNGDGATPDDVELVVMKAMGLTADEFKKGKE